MVLTDFLLQSSCEILVHLTKSGAFLSFFAVFNTYCVGCRSCLLPGARSAFLGTVVSLEIEALRFCTPGIEASSHDVARSVDNSADAWLLVQARS